MAVPPLPPGIAAPVPEAPPTPPASECNDLDFNLENVDKVGGSLWRRSCCCTTVSDHCILVRLARASFPGRSWSSPDGWAVPHVHSNDCVGDRKISLDASVPFVVHASRCWTRSGLT